MLPPDVPQYFIPIRGSQPSGSTLIYQPMLLGASQVRVSDSKAGVDVTQDVTVLAPISEGAVAVDWNRAMEASLTVADLGIGAIRWCAVRICSQCGKQSQEL